MKAYKKIPNNHYILVYVGLNKNEIIIVRGRRLAARSFKMVGKANKTRNSDQLQRKKTPLTFLSI